MGAIYGKEARCKIRFYMTWNDLTVGQYQRLYGILKQTDKTNLDILTEIISVCEGYAIDEIESSPDEPGDPSPY